MRVDGRWHLFRDGIARPVVDVVVELADGTWLDAMFLLDSGADRTVLDSSFLPLLAANAVPTGEAPELRGVGGDARCVFVRSAIGLIRADGRRVSVRGSFGVFTDPASSDVPVLGRDVTNNFEVIYSFPRREVVLLAPPHRAEIGLDSSRPSI